MYLQRRAPHLPKPSAGDVRGGERGVEGEKGVVEPVLSCMLGCAYVCICV